jgi:hypothetical protein
MRGAGTISVPAASEEVAVNARSTHHVARPSPPSLQHKLSSWAEAGLITPEQARAITEHESLAPGRPSLTVVPPAGPAGPSLVVEALGYLGGVIMLVGAGLLVGIYWEDLSTALRLLLLAGVAVLLVAAGSAVSDRLGPAAGRLRSVLWALAVAATGAFAAVLTADVLDLHDEDALVVFGPITAAVAAVLWWLRRTWLQHLALLVPVMVSAAGVALQLSDAEAAPGFAVFAVGVAWVALAWFDLLTPREVGVAVGAVAATFGALTIGGDSAARNVGVALGLAAALGLVALALLERDLPWLGVGAVLLLWSAPRAMVEWFPGRMSAALTLLVTGGLLVGAAIWVARHRGGPGEPTGAGG